MTGWFSHVHVLISTQLQTPGGPLQISVRVFHFLCQLQLPWLLCISSAPGAFHTLPGALTPHHSQEALWAGSWVITGVTVFVSGLSGGHWTSSLTSSVLKTITYFIRISRWATQSRSMFLGKKEESVYGLARC